MAFYAHSLADRALSEWEPLEDHLKRVSELAGAFAAKWGAEEWGRLAGWWHDLGKYRPEFQAMLMHANGFEAHLETEADSKRVEHSIAGARHAIEQSNQIGKILAFCIAGHHAGLPDFGIGPSELQYRLDRSQGHDVRSAPHEILELDLPKKLTDGWKMDSEIKRAGFQTSLFTRMLFSALVDGDYLATEEFMNPLQSHERLSTSVPISELKECLKHYLEQKSRSPLSTVNTCRQEILQSCLSAATLTPGLFSLTVPTGGGKTLSSLAFALQHAEQYDMDRVVVAIPFTSIIEQTADVYREVFSGLGENVVLEHHSNLDPLRETVVSRLRTENWDSSLIVTTNVQLLESLFGSKPSRCRKLHRLARSVIILDEAQTIPVNFLLPCLYVLQELVENYGCSIVLCSATQPALNQRPEFKKGLKEVREIIPDPINLSRRMKRVQVSKLGTKNDGELASMLHEHERALCIVNTRPHAFRLFSELKNLVSNSEQDGLFHLSTRMCPVHRTDSLNEIRKRLKAGKTCRVVSTQLIEAGVDISFPVVYRPLAGLDSIAQAAGRCNREGELDIGRLFLFEPEDLKLFGFLKSTSETAREVLGLSEGSDPLELEAIQKYFQLHYWRHTDAWDKKDVLGDLSDFQGMSFNFRTAGRKFKLIEETGQSVIVPWGSEGKRLCDRLTNGGDLSRAEWRALQRYTISVLEQPFNELAKRGDIQVNDTLPAILVNMHCYDADLGLCVERAGQYEPEQLVI